MNRKEPPEQAGMPQGRDNRAIVDVRNHLAQRRAMGHLLQRQKQLLVVRESFHDGAVTARIRFGRRYYDVDGDALAQIRAGADPRDLWSAEEVDPGA